MNLARRAAGFVCAMALILSGGGLATTPASASQPTFSDVVLGSKFYDDVMWLVSNGITTGYPDNTFRPQKPVTREAMAVYIYRFAGKPSFALPPERPFADMTPSSKFYKEVTWLASTGITTGYPDNTFRPKALTQRQAMAAFIHRFDTNPNVDLDPTLRD